LGAWLLKGLGDSSLFGILLLRCDLFLPNVFLPSAMGPSPEPFSLYLYNNYYTITIGYIITIIFI
jgi:hypothetical protein